MKKAKLLAVLAAIVMAMGIFAACGSQKTSTEPAPAQPAQQTTTEQPAQSAQPAANALVDGAYKVAFDNFDAHGWKGQVEIEIKDGKIASVKYDYVNKDGKLKSQDAGYRAAMEPKTKTYPEKYEKELADQLVQKQSVASVDDVTGATESSKEFKMLAGYILDNMAKKGDTNPATLPLPKTE